MLLTLKEDFRTGVRLLPLLKLLISSEIILMKKKITVESAKVDTNTSVLPNNIPADL